MANNEEKKEFDKLKELQKKIKDQSVKKNYVKWIFIYILSF